MFLVLSPLQPVTPAREEFRLFNTVTDGPIYNIKLFKKKKISRIFIRQKSFEYIQNVEKERESAPKVFIKIRKR